jgi:HEAT repeat protein
MDEETEALVTMLRASRRPSIRLEAVRRLAELRDPELAPVLLECLRDADEPRNVPVITAALAALQHLGPPVAVPALALLADRSDRRRVFMPLLLASALGPNAVPSLLAAVGDEDLDVAINAATQIGQLRAAEAFPQLLAVAENPKAPSALRGASAAALGALRDQRALPFLIGLLQAPDSDLLSGAIDGLADLRDPEGAPYLEKLLERPDLGERTQRAVRLALLAMERYRR